MKTKLFTRYILIILIITGVDFYSFAQETYLEEYTFENDQTGKNPSGSLKCSGNCPLVTSEISCNGEKALKTFVDRINSETMYRTEVAHGTRMEVNKGEETTEYWMGISFYVPSPYPSLKKPVYEIFFQLHASPIDGNWNDYPGQNPNLAFSLIPKTDNSGNIRISLKGIDIPYPQTEKQPHDVWDETNTYQTDKWHKLVIHTRLDYSDGFTKIWLDGEKVIDYKGKNYYRGHGKCYAKFGLYNGWRDRNIDEPVKTRTIYHDDFRFAYGDSANYDLVAPKRKTGEMEK